MFADKCIGDKSVRLLDLYICNKLLETVTTHSSFQTIRRSLNDYFVPKCK